MLIGLTYKFWCKILQIKQYFARFWHTPPILHDSKLRAVFAKNTIIIKHIAKAKFSTTKIH